MKGYSFIKEKEQLFKKERRINKRYQYDSTFKIESVNLERVNLDAKGIELSICGIGFISEVGFKVNDMLEIAFKYNNVTIPAIIEVRHVNLYDFGFVVGGQFVALNDEYRKILKDFE